MERKREYKIIKCENTEIKQLIKYQTYKNNILHGVTAEFDIDNHVINYKNYKNGMLDMSCVWKNGKIKI